MLDLKWKQQDFCRQKILQSGLSFNRQANFQVSLCGKEAPLPCFCLFFFFFKKITQLDQTVAHLPPEVSREKCSSGNVSDVTSSIFYSVCCSNSHSSWRAPSCLYKSWQLTAARCLAQPKSHSLTTPFESTTQFAPLMSLGGCRGIKQNKNISAQQQTNLKSLNALPSPLSSLLLLTL